MYALTCIHTHTHIYIYTYTHTNPFSHSPSMVIKMLELAFKKYKLYLNFYWINKAPNKYHSINIIVLWKGDLINIWVGSKQEFGVFFQGQYTSYPLSCNETF